MYTSDLAISKNIFEMFGMGLLHPMIVCGDGFGVNCSVVDCHIWLL